MDCKGCGDCCKDPTIIVPLEDRHKKLEFTRWLMGFGFDVQVVGGLAYVRVPGRCLWLNEHNRCDIYSQRPQLCRVYQCEENGTPKL